MRYTYNAAGLSSQKRCFYEETGKAPGSGWLQSTLDLIEAKAQADGPERAVSLRVGRLEGKLYLDLCDSTWRAAPAQSRPISAACAWR